MRDDLIARMALELRIIRGKHGICLDLPVADVERVDALLLECAALTAQGEPAPTPDEISRDISSGLRRWAAKNKAQGKPRAERAEADAATLREQVREWAIYCFTRHGNDAHLYNGLAELAALTSGGDTKPPARGLRELYENPEFRARYDAELEKARRDLALPAAEGLLRVLSEYDLRDQIHGLEPWVQDAVEAAIRALRAVSEGRR